jgi:hypothetical protein
LDSKLAIETVLIVELAKQIPLRFDAKKKVCFAQLEWYTLLISTVAPSTILLHLLTPVPSRALYSY